MALREITVNADVLEEKGSVVDLYTPLGSIETLFLVLTGLRKRLMGRYASDVQFKERTKQKIILARQNKTIREIGQIRSEHPTAEARQKLRRLLDLIIAVDNRGQSNELVSLYEEFLRIFHTLSRENRTALGYTSKEVQVLQTASYFLLEVGQGSMIQDVVRVCTEINHGKPVFEPENVLQLS